MGAGPRRMVAVAVAVAAAALAVPAATQAKVVTYGGKAFPGGVIAFDVKVDKRKVPKRILEVRASDVPAECEVSKEAVTVWTRVRNLDVKVRNGGFKLILRDPQYGNRSKITGEFTRKNRKLGGGFSYSSHFPAENGLPEEDCNTGPLLYAATRGGEDVTVPPAGASGRRG